MSKIKGAKKYRKVVNFVKQFLLLIIILCVIFPLIWLFMASLTYRKDLYAMKMISPPTLQNYQQIFFGDPNFVGPLLNSFIVVISTLVIVVALAAPAAYAFSRIRTHFSNTLLTGIIGSQFMPPIAIVIPFYVFFRNLGLLDTRIALVIMYVSLTLPFVIWILVGFMEGLPREIEEAAFIDGCGRLRLMVHIVFPLMRPGIAVSVILAAIMALGEFLFALTLTYRHAETVTVGLMRFWTEQGLLWDLMAAAGVLILIPLIILTIFVQGDLVKSFSLGSIKG